jgi:hypothetical protein
MRIKTKGRHSIGPCTVVVIFDTDKTHIDD